MKNRTMTDTKQPKPDRLVDFINRWTLSTKKTQLDIMNWAAGMNSSDDEGRFFSKNKTRFITLGIFIAIGLICYLLGLKSIAIVSLIIVIVQLLSWGWGLLFPKK